MILRILLPLLAVLWLAMPAQAQTPAKLCFPTTTASGGKVSCQDVTAANPLPTTASLSASALNVTVVNTTAAPVFVSNPNGFGGSISGTLTVQNLGAGSLLNVLETNSGSILSALTGSTPSGTNVIGKVDIDQTTPGTTNGTSIAYIGSSAALSGNGVSGTGSLRVNVASDNTPFTVSLNQATPGFTGTNAVTAGASFTQSITPTLTTTGYATGNCIAGFNAITLANYNGESGFITNFRVTSLSPSSTQGTAPQFNLYLFDSQPTTSTCTDKGTFSLSAADIDKLIATTQTGSLAASTGATTPTNVSYDFSPPKPFIAGGSTSSGVKTIYFGLQAAAAFTASSTTDLRIRAGAALN